MIIIKERKQKMNNEYILFSLKIRNYKTEKKKKKIET